MHAAALADSLSVDRVVVPRPGGVLSAFGLLAADESYDAVRTVGVGLEGAAPADLEAVYDDLVADVLADASDPDAARIERAADCRYAGQSFELTVAVGDEFDAAAVADRFHDAHERTYGYTMDESIEVVNLRATATVPGSEPAIRHEGAGDARIGTREAHFPGSARGMRPSTTGIGFRRARPSRGRRSSSRPRARPSCRRTGRGGFWRTARSS